MIEAPVRRAYTCTHTHIYIYANKTLALSEAVNHPRGDGRAELENVSNYYVLLSDVGVPVNGGYQENVQVRNACHRAQLYTYARGKIGPSLSMHDLCIFIFLFIYSHIFLSV